MMINKMLIRKWRVPIAIAAVIIFLMFFSGPGCGNQWMLFYDRPIKGHVVDAETGKPIEGALVVGMWQLSQFLSQGFGGYAKVIVVQTDRQGKFKLPFWVAFKPWKIDSAMRDGAPAIMLYKPGYRFSQRVLLERYAEDPTLALEVKNVMEEKNRLTPARLTKAYTDEDRIQNYHDWSTYADIAGPHFSRKQKIKIYEAIAEDMSHLPKEKAYKYGLHN